MTDATAPRVLIEDWLPVTELGIESRRERAVAMDLPPIFALHVWWARRPLVASAGVVLASVLPPWSEALAADYPGDARVSSEPNYKKWFLHLCGIWGDPISARRKYDIAVATGVRVPNPYDYKQAYKNRPNPADLDLLHRILEKSWGALPSLIDPTAGGGSIPFAAVRYGIPAHANDLNQVAAVTLRAGVEVPARFGLSVTDELAKWGEVLIRRVAERLRPYFPAGPNERVATFLFARSVACPRTGKPVPLAPNWWISKAKGGEIAAQVVTERNGVELDIPEFDVLHGDDAVRSEPDQGTVSRGSGMSPWDGLVIDGDYIKREAAAGRMGSILYAVAIRRPEQTSSGKTKWVRSFRAPTQADLDALDVAESDLAELLPRWIAEEIVPTEHLEEGLKTSEPLRYGIDTWRKMFSPRQLLVQGIFVDELRRLTPEIMADTDEGRGEAIVGVLSLMQGKLLNFNSLLSTWHAGRELIRAVFDSHNLAFKWSYAEFEAVELVEWALGGKQLVRAFGGIAGLLQPGTQPWALAGQTVAGDLSELRHPVPAAVRVTRGSGGALAGVADGSQTLVCIDPPYYDNVMYGELSDFFGVWEQHTVGKVWDDLMPGGAADLKNEAVANPARFKEFGRRKKELSLSILLCE